MDEKKKAYDILVEVWRLSSKYIFSDMSDDMWQEFIDSGCALSKKYSGRYNKFFRALFMAFSDLKENELKGE